MRFRIYGLIWRLLVVMIVVCAINSANYGQGLDRFGGWTGLQGHNTSGYFRVEKLDGRYWLVTPDNNIFWSVGVCVVQWNDTWGGYSPTLNYYPNPYNNKAKYNNDLNAWTTTFRNRYSSYGMNTLPAWCIDVSNITECYNVLCVSCSAQSRGCRMASGNFADVFDPKFAQGCDDSARGMASKATSQWRIGSFPDNELFWANPRVANCKTLPDAFIAFPRNASGKQYWVNTFLKGKYATIADLNTAWGTSFIDWDTGLTTDNTVANVTSVPDNATYPKRLSDKIDFQEAIADQYYRIASERMRYYDPNHLVFSARWAMWWDAYGDPYYFPFNERTWKKAGQYCDIIANNGYADFGSAETAFQHSTRLFANAKKPFMVTEHAYLANDSYFKDQQWWLPTQMDRAVNLQNQLKTLMDMSVTTDPNDGQPAKTCMGLHWFQYYDEPALGRPDYEAAQFGILNVKDEPFLPMVDVMSTVNKQIYGYTALGQPIVVPNAPTAVQPTAASYQVGESASSAELIYYPNDTAISHSTGSVVDDASASNGKAWKGTAGVSTNTYIQYGPYLSGTAFWRSSLCTVNFRLKTSSNTSPSLLATVDVSASGGASIMASRDIKCSDFTAPNTYQDFTVSFTTSSSTLPDQWEFRVLYRGAADIWIDTTTFTMAPSSTYSIGSLSDSLYTTTWSSAGHSSADAVEWAAIDLGSVRTGVNTVTITPGSFSPCGMPVDFRMEYSIDGTRWFLIPGQTYTNIVNNSEALKLNFMPMKARYLRLYATKLAADDKGIYRLVLGGLDVLQATGTATPLFQWTSVPNAASYTLLYSPEQGFPEEQTIRVDNIPGTSFTPTQPLSPGTWYWTVKAVDDQGRGGHYLKTVKFNVGNFPASQVDPALNLRGEQVTAWSLTDQAMTSCTGTVWVFRDTNRKAEGDSSIKVTFTVNSLIKRTGKINPATTKVPWKWTGPEMDYSGADNFSFKLYPQRFVDSKGTMISPSKYLWVKLTDAIGGVIIDRQVDSTGALTRDAWSTVSIPLGALERSHITGIVFYIKCSDTNLTWDERMIFNIDDITQGIVGDFTAPSVPIVTDAGNYTTQLNSLGASWSSSDPESSITEYVYALGTAPGSADIVPWTSTTSPSVNVSGLSLTPYTMLYFSTQAKNAWDLWSDQGYSDGIFSVTSFDIGDIRNNANGADVTIPCGIVTAGIDQFYGNFYVEALSGTSGIRIYAPTAKAYVGDLLRITGKILTQSGERYVTTPVITPLGKGTALKPVYLTGKDIGGCAPNPYTLGVYQSTGLYNVGLLIKTFGKVTTVNSTYRYFYIDDGSGRNDLTGNAGIRVSTSSLASGNVINMPAAGTYVTVTGILTTLTSQSKTIPSIRPRTQSDIVPF